MRKERAKSDAADKGQFGAYRVKLPVFIGDQDVGLGDLIKRATSVLGYKPCGGCDRRAAALNRWMVLSGSRPK